MKNLVVLSTVALLTACSGGGSSSGNEAQASGDDYFLIERERAVTLDVLRNDDYDWSEPDRLYSLVIIESSSFDRGIQEGGEFALDGGLEFDPGFELPYDPDWSMQADWGVGDAFETKEIDSFKYEIWDVVNAETVYGPVTVTIEWRPQLYVAGPGEGGDDNNPGTRDQPLETVSRALELAGPGDVIQICHEWEIEAFGPDRWPWVISDGVLLRGRTFGSFVWGQGEYYAESIDEVIWASVVLEGDGAGVSNLDLSPSVLGGHEFGVYMEGRDLKLWNTQIRGFEVGIACVNSRDIMIQGVQVSAGLGIYAAGSVGTCTLRDSGVTDCEGFGVLLERANDLDLGTEASPGGNWLARNFIGLSWQIEEPGDFQSAYGNEWNEYPLYMFVNGLSSFENHYDVLSEQSLFIDSRGGWEHGL